MNIQARSQSYVTMQVQLGDCGPNTNTNTNTNININTNINTNTAAIIKLLLTQGKHRWPIANCSIVREETTRDFFLTKENHNNDNKKERKN